MNLQVASKWVQERALFGVGAALLAFAAYQGVWNHRARILRVARGELGHRDWEKYLQGVAAAPEATVSWCGIFSLWVLHKAGVGTHVPWEYGKGFLYRTEQTSNPQAGDIAYIDVPFQHHAIVEAVEGDTVHTIDGNADGQVMRRTRPRSAFTAFYNPLTLK